MNTFPLMISIQDNNGDKINNVEKYFDTFVFKIIMDKNGKVYQDPLDDYHLEKCDFTKFKENGDLVKEYIEQSNGTDFYCLNFNSIHIGVQRRTNCKRFLYFICS